ncbi:MAG: hypothetical protein ACYC1C_14925 [Chloroflexota bacterium]
MNPKRYILAILVIGSVLLAGLSQGSATASPAPIRAHIGFGTAISDAEIRVLLADYSVTPTAAYMWTSGLTGTHRAYSPQTVEALLHSARAESIESFEKSLQRAQLRLQQFTDKYSEEELIADAALQMQARSLLNIRENLKVALAAAESGDPLVFAIEVTGDNVALDRLREDARVRAFEVRDGVGDKGAHRALKPAAYQQPQVDPEIETASGRELYARLRAAAFGQN